MERPSLEEVIKYFNNAAVIKSVYNTNGVYSDKNIHIDNEAYFCETENKVGLAIWHKKYGYAKILTYKNTEPKFEITKEQIKEIKELSLLCKPAATVSKLKEWFPEAFKDKTKLKESLWYKSIDYPKWMLCVTNVNFKEKRVKGYGFGSDGNWMGNADNDSWEFNEFDRCLEMSEQEVFEALKNEAVKRYNKTNYLICLHHGTCSKIDLEYKTAVDEKGFWYGGKCVMKDGKWVEIIPTKTIQEAEELLKELGHNFKIV